jgi:MSHA biogenesis protein MshI
MMGWLQRWRGAAAHEVAAIGTGADGLAWAVADSAGRVRRCGVEPHVAGEGADERARRLRALGLPAQRAFAVLPLADAQLVAIDAPAVQPEELRAAARWKVKELIDGRLDQMTLDVMFVGDGRERTPRQLFVVAAPNEAIAGVVAQAQGAGVALAAIDIAETCQRNLQTAAAAAAGLGGRATAALVRHGAHVLLTICAGGELYDARRLDWEALQGAAAPAAAAPEPAPIEAAALETMDIVDYGAEPETAAVAETPRLVVEVQRSFDHWERSWPDLPLAALWVHAGDATAALVPLLAEATGQRVEALAPERFLPGLAEAPPPALLPVLGALLRRDDTKL